MSSQGQPFELVEKDIPHLAADEVLIKVAGCGVCHTDISFWHYGVKTRHPLPLTLGHEIGGTVVAGPNNWLGKKVIVPAVLPCGECDLCKSGRSNICRNQQMPGNDFDGGFASHVKVPSRHLCVLPDKALDNHSLAELSVIADAVSTPYQAIKKSGLKEDDFAIVIGVGGIGIYGASIAKLLDAKVLAIDINDARLNAVKELGIDETLNVTELDFKTIKSAISKIAQNLSAKPHSWKIFEMSGTKNGQELAFGLITYASTLSIVGFTLDKLELRLSNLMAFDAEVIGTWGCKPELYSEVVELVADGKLKIKPFIQTFPMSQINEVFKNTLEHKYNKRSILVPDFLDALSC